MGKKNRRKREEQATQMLAMLSYSPTRIRWSGIEDPSKFDPQSVETERPEPTGPFAHLLKVPKSRRVSLIPADAKSAPIVHYLEFLDGAPKPRTIGGQLYCEEPPIAMRCPACDLRQGVVGGRGMSLLGDFASFPRCTYCGLSMTIVGTKLAWWR